MTLYTLIVEVPQAGKEVKCEVDLNGSYQNYPEDYFRHSQNRESVRKTLQANLQRDVSQSQADGLIQEWIQAIQRGKAVIKRTLNLHLTTDQDSFAQNTMPPSAISSLISPSSTNSPVQQADPRLPAYPPRPPRPLDPLRPSPPSRNDSVKQPPATIPDPKSDSEPEYTSVESISNTADF